MTGILKLYLKANEKIFINGAVLKPDRKVALELLNNAHFLLEQHVIQAEQADTPLKQIYYIVQLMVMSPSESESMMSVFMESMAALIKAFENPKILAELKEIDALVRQQSYYMALKSIRNLFSQEQEILGKLPQGKDANIERSDSQRSKVLS